MPTLVTIDADSSANEAAAPSQIPFRAWSALRAALDPGLVSSVALVVVLSLAARAASTAKDLVVAYRFGVSDALDAFILASLIPTSILYAFSASAGYAFLPIYVSERHRAGEAAARRVLGAATWLGAVTMLAAAAVLVLAGPWAIAALAGGFVAAKADLTLLLYLGLLPTAIAGGAAAVWPAALNARGRQVVTAAVPIVTPLLTLVLVATLASGLGVATLVAGAVGGAILEAAILGLALARARALAFGPFTRDPVTMRFARDVVALVGAALISLGSSVVDQGMAASLGPGAVSTYAYATKVLTFVTGIAGIALTMVVLPRFAELAIAGGRRLRASYLPLLVIAFVGGAAVSAVLVLGSEGIVRALFERGSFDAAATSAVAPVQTVLGLQLPFAIANLLTVRLLIAIGRIRGTVVAAGFELAVHVAGNVLLTPILGLQGIALSGAVSTGAMFLVMTAWAMRSIATDLRRRDASLTGP